LGARKLGIHRWGLNPVTQAVGQLPAERHWLQAQTVNAYASMRRPHERQ